MSQKRNTPPDGGGTGLFRQMGQSLDKVLGKFNSRADREPPPPIGKNLSSAPALALCSRLEGILALDGDKTPWPQEVLKFALSYSGLSWAFLTEILTGDPRHFVIIAGQPFPSGLEVRQPMASGLAGYVHGGPQPLAIPSVRNVENLSFVFRPGDPLKKAETFYGWPLVYNETIRGALLLVGKANQVLDDQALGFLDFLAQRLSAHYQQDKLCGRVVELTHLDAQTGLPHRTYFVERLGQMIEARKDEGVTVALLNVSGLGRFALSFGQPEAYNLLRALAQDLLENSGPDWELGHLSYGLFALAAPATEQPSLDNTVIVFQKRLSEWPIPTRTGRANFIFHQARSSFPADGLKPEMLLEVALSNLALAE
ncbi:MAG: hypothetical protein LBL95_09095 [Deltaproteobacteria bacterium]|nr:hypothetical protein [Deltaproteobacteria bacterium]